MRCQEFENRLNAVLDERTNPESDSRLTAHARDCEECRSLLTGQRSLFAGLRQSSVPRLSPAFSRRAVEQAAVVSAPCAAPAPQRVWLAVGALLASAAAALLTVSLVWYARRGPSVTNEGGSATAAIMENGKPTGPASNRSRSRHGTYGGGFALAQPGWLVEAPRLPDHVQTSIDSLPQALPATIERINEVERLAPGMRPIWRSFALLWNTLCHALPGTRDQGPPTRNRTSAWWLETLQFA